MAALFLYLAAPNRLINLTTPWYLAMITTKKSRSKNGLLKPNLTLNVQACGTIPTQALYAKPIKKCASGSALIQEQSLLAPVLPVKIRYSLFKISIAIQGSAKWVLAALAPRLLLFLVLKSAHLSTLALKTSLPVINKLVPLFNTLAT